MYLKFQKQLLNIYVIRRNGSLHESVFSIFRLFIRMLSLLSSELASFPESTEACLRIFRGFPSLEDSFSSLSFSDDKDEAANAIFSLASGCLDNRKVNKFPITMPITITLPALTNYILYLSIQKKSESREW